MKEKMDFSVNTDILTIEIDAMHAHVTVQEAADGVFKIEYPEAQNISVGTGGDGVILSQRKYPLCKFRAQEVGVFIPSHTVPEIRIHAKNCSLSVRGGIYGNLSCSFGDGTVNLADAVFGGVEITGDGVDVTLSGVTVKGNLFMQIEKGDLLAENTFATRADCKVRKGNIGLATLNCKDCAFNTDRGNITATIAGDEQSFNTTLLTREGTLNREGAKRDGADASFQAYAGKGNIVLDFADEKPPVPEPLPVGAEVESESKERSDAIKENA